MGSEMCIRDRRAAAAAAAASSPVGGAAPVARQGFVSQGLALTPVAWPHSPLSGAGLSHDEVLRAAAAGVAVAGAADSPLGEAASPAFRAAGTTQAVAQAVVQAGASSPGGLLGAGASTFLPMLGRGPSYSGSGDSSAMAGSSSMRAMSVTPSKLLQRILGLNAAAVEAEAARVTR